MGSLRSPQHCLDNTREERVDVVDNSGLVL